jgi:hypothetical protein
MPYPPDNGVYDDATPRIAAVIFWLSGYRLVPSGHNGVHASQYAAALRAHSC